MGSVETEETDPGAREARAAGGDAPSPPSDAPPPIASPPSDPPRPDPPRPSASPPGDAPQAAAPRPGAGRPRAPLFELGRGAAWLVGLAAVLQLISYALGASPLAAALAGAVIADIAAARAGVRWDPPGPRTRGDHRGTALRLGAGAGLGALAVALTLAAGLALGWASVAAGTPSAGFLLALLRSAAIAVRDELLLTGIAFAAASRAGIPSRHAVVFAATAHGAAIALAPGASLAAVALAVALGALYARLWERRGALAAIAAAAAFHVLAGTGLRGALLDVTWRAGSLTAGARASGGAAWLATAAAVAAILLEAQLARRRSR